MKPSTGAPGGAGSLPRRVPAAAVHGVAAHVQRAIQASLSPSPNPPRGGAPRPPASAPGTGLEVARHVRQAIQPFRQAPSVPSRVPVPVHGPSCHRLPGRQPPPPGREAGRPPALVQPSRAGTARTAAPTARSGPGATLQAKISRQGDFQELTGKYRTAYLVFYEAMRRVTPDFRDIDWDPYTDLVFTTESAIPTSGETRLEVHDGSGWVKDSNPLIRNFLHSRARVRIVVGLTQADPPWSLPQILQTMAHEWGVHAHWYWRFVQWMRRTASAEEVEDAWSERQSRAFSGEVPLHGDIHHTLLAHDEASVFRDISNEIERYLPEIQRQKFWDLTSADIAYHENFKRKPQEAQPVNSAFSELDSFVPEMSNKEQKDFEDFFG